MAASNFARTIRNLDRRLFLVIFRLKWAPLTTVLHLFTLLGTAGFLWGAFAAAAFAATGFENLWHLLVPWASVALSWTVAEGAKYLFNRARPFISDTQIAPLIKTPSSSSFPSGHAATAAAGAITLSAVYPILAPAFLLAGFLVTLSRVYLGVHYPFDVLAGICIGGATAGFVLAAAETLSA